MRLFIVCVAWGVMYGTHGCWIPACMLCTVYAANNCTTAAHKPVLIMSLSRIEVFPKSRESAHKPRRWYNTFWYMKHDKRIGGMIHFKVVWSSIMQKKTLAGGSIDVTVRLRLAIVWFGCSFSNDCGCFLRHSVKTHCFGLNTTNQNSKHADTRTLYSNVYIGTPRPTTSKLRWTALVSTLRFGCVRHVLFTLWFHESSSCVNLHSDCKS